MLKLLVGRDYPKELTQAIKNSVVSVRILMYDWRWYSHQPGSKIQILNSEIIKAKKRGVDVRVVLNTKHIKRLLESFDIKVVITNASRTMHIKLVLIDEKLLFIGSHNFSINAFEINHEMSLMLDDKEIISRCLLFFNNICLS